jgi:hypothetical protein
VIDFKTFNMHVVTPHEFFMALMPEQFPWESRVITDFSQILSNLSGITSKASVKEVEEAKNSEIPDETALAIV